MQTGLEQHPQAQQGTHNLSNLVVSMHGMVDPNYAAIHALCPLTPLISYIALQQPHLQQADQHEESPAMAIVISI